MSIKNIGKHAMHNDSDTKISTTFLTSLLRGIHHDMGAPARHLLNFSQMLNTLDDLPLQENHRQWLLYIQQGGNQLQGMISSLGSLAQLCQPRDVRHLHLGELFQEVAQQVGPETSLHIDSQTAWPEVKACKVHWQVLFLNLLNNSQLFHPSDATHRKQIEVSCVKQADQVVFTIDDNGIGVSEDNRKELGRAFKRFNGKDYPGLGMGLCYCLLIAELNAGSLVFSGSPLGGLRVIYSQSLNA